MATVARHHLVCSQHAVSQEHRHRTWVHHGDFPSVVCVDFCNGLLQAGRDSMLGQKNTTCVMNALLHKLLLLEFCVQPDTFTVIFLARANGDTICMPSLKLLLPVIPQLSSQGVCTGGSSQWHSPQDVACQHCRTVSCLLLLVRTCMLISLSQLQKISGRELSVNCLLAAAAKWCSTFTGNPYLLARHLVEYYLCCCPTCVDWSEADRVRRILLARQEFFGHSWNGLQQPGYE
jgi:hypothetical protein